MYRVPKRFLTLDGQCQHLIKNKSVIINDLSKAKKILLENNYFNLVSCAKVKFAVDIQKGLAHVYKKSDFDEWVDYFHKDCKVSEYLMHNLIRLERSLNSRAAYYVSALIDSGILSEDEFDDLKNVVQGETDPKKSLYDGTETWIFIAKKTFGGFRQVIKWLHKNNQKGIIKKIVSGYGFLKKNTLKKIDELVHLRNNLFHFRPLSIYLAYGTIRANYSQYNLRREIISDVFFQNPCSSIRPLMVEFFSESKIFVDLKQGKEIFR